MYTTIGNYYSF